MESLFPFFLVALVAVVLFVLPARQRKRMAEQAKALHESLTVGTPIMTTSGIHGTVAGKGDTTVDVEVAPGVVVTFARQAVLEVRRPVEGAPSGGATATGTGTDGPATGEDTPGGRRADGTV